MGKRKKKKVSAIKISKTEKPEVVKLPKVTEEESVVVKQPFTDPTKDTALFEKIVTELEEIDKEEKKDVVFNTPELSYDDKQDLKILDAIMELPSPLMTPTNRQYGEQFLPDYIRVRNKLRRLAGLS